MKRVIRCICMVALVALAFTSCKKNEEKSSVMIMTQELVDEYVDEDRAYFTPGNLRIMFEEGDVVMIFNIDEEVPTHSHCAQYAAEQTGNFVKFNNMGTGEVAEDILDAYYAFYPGGREHIQTEMAQGENKSKFLVAPVQEYRPDMVPLGAMYMAAKVDDVEHLSQTNDPENAFFFRNICGVYDLMLYDADGPSVKEISITDHALDLSGWVELIIPEVDPVEMQSLFNNYDPNNATYMQNLAQYLNRVGYNVTEKGNTITLTMPEEGVQIGTTQGDATHFYMILRPLACFNDYTITVTLADGSVRTKEVSNPNHVVAPNGIKHHGFNFGNW